MDILPFDSRDRSCLIEVMPALAGMTNPLQQGRFGDQYQLGCIGNTIHSFGHFSDAGIHEVADIGVVVEERGPPALLLNKRAKISGFRFTPKQTGTPFRSPGQRHPYRYQQRKHRAVSASGFHPPVPGNPVGIHE